MHRTTEESDMLTREIAKQQIQDRVEDAQRDRAGRSAQADRRPARATAVRRVGSGMLASVVGRRKTTPSSTPIGLPLA
jgi:hypothetical protein